MVVTGGVLDGLCGRIDGIDGMTLIDVFVLV
jgi:hypothetical protein